MANFQPVALRLQLGKLDTTVQWKLLHSFVSRNINRVTFILICIFFYFLSFNFLSLQTQHPLQDSGASKATHSAQWLHDQPCSTRQPAWPTAQPGSHSITEPKATHAQVDRKKSDTVIGQQNIAVNILLLFKKIFFAMFWWLMIWGFTTLPVYIRCAEVGLMNIVAILLIFFKPNNSSQL